MPKHTDTKIKSIVFPETTLQFWKQLFKPGLLFGTLLPGYKIVVVLSEIGITRNPCLLKGP